jgi:hypothetical protein
VAKAENMFEQWQQSTLNPLSAADQHMLKRAQHKKKSDTMSLWLGREIQEAAVPDSIPLVSLASLLPKFLAASASAALPQWPGIPKQYRW